MNINNEANKMFHSVNIQSIHKHMEKLDLFLLIFNKNISSFGWRSFFDQKLQRLAERNVVTYKFSSLFSVQAKHKYICVKN